MNEGTGKLRNKDINNNTVKIKRNRNKMKKKIN